MILMWENSHWTLCSLATINATFFSSLCRSAHSVREQMCEYVFENLSRVFHTSWVENETAIIGHSIRSRIINRLFRVEICLIRRLIAISNVRFLSLLLLTNRSEVVWVLVILFSCGNWENEIDLFWISISCTDRRIGSPYFEAFIVWSQRRQVLMIYKLKFHLHNG